MFNTQLQDQLTGAISKGKLNPKHFDGYVAWKTKFDYFYNITHDLEKTLDILYGPKGGVNDYKGSLYRNSNLSTDNIPKQNQPRKIKPKVHHNAGALGLFKTKGK
jgi:hypothetical protein